MKQNIQKILVVLIAFFCVIPFVHGEETKKTETKTVDGFIFEANDGIDRTENINGSALLLGNNVTMNQFVKGLGAFFGNNVTVNGETDYLLSGGNNVTLGGAVLKDGMALGNILVFKDTFHAKRDLSIFGADITLNGDVDRDLIIAASKVIIDGSNVGRNVTINAQNIEIKGDTKITGTLKYNEDATITVASSAKIGTKEVIPLSELNRVTYLDQVWANVISYASLLVVFVVLAFLTPKVFKKVERSVTPLPVSNVFVSAGLGALGLVLSPFILFALFMTVIGVPLAFLIIAVLVISIYLTTLFVGYVIGYKIWTRFFKQEPNMLLVGLLGIGILFVCSIIPYVGSLVGMMTFFYGLGLIIQLFKKEKQN